MSEPRVVLKFGGTSVATKPQWETIACLVHSGAAQELAHLLHETLVVDGA